MELYHTLLQHQERNSDLTMTNEQSKYIINNSLASVATVNKLVRFVADKALLKRYIKLYNIYRRYTIFHLIATSLIIFVGPNFPSAFQSSFDLS